MPHRPNPVPRAACILTLLATVARGDPADSTVVFNEVHYHPVEAGAHPEWIELYNQMGVDMDISGWSLSEGVVYVFPAGTILRGRSYLVVAASPSALQAATGYAGALGPFVGRLDNSGERLELRNNSFRIMDSMRYRDEDEWPVGPDGSGLTLAKTHPDLASEPAASWRSSREIGGTPGAVNFPPAEGGDGGAYPPGLVSYWSFDDSGSTATDLAGTNHGTLGSAATRVPGLVGSGALSFDDSTNAYVSVGSGASFSVTAGLSIEALVRPEWSGAFLDADDIYRKEDGANRVVFGFQHDGIEAGRDVAISPPSQPVLSFGLNVGGAYSKLDMPLDGVAGRPTLAALQDGEAHYLAATYDSVTGRKAIWVDGALAFSASLAPGSLVSSGGGTTAYVGNMSGRGEPFTGVLDEVTYWSRGLEAAEVLGHFRSFQAGQDYFSGSAGPVATGLVFNEISSGSGAAGWIELVNLDASPADLLGTVIVKDGLAPGERVLPEQTVGSGGRAVVTGSDLGFDLVAGDRLFLFTPARDRVLDAAEVKEGLKGRHPDGTGRWLRPSSPTPGAPNVFSLQDSIVINEVMYHPRPLPETPPVLEDTVLVPIGSAWKYDGSGVDRGTAWRAPGFSDASWPVGSALLYNETAELPAPKGTQLVLGPITYYFRTSFELPGNPAGAELRLRTVIDDGAVFYLNGVEVLRYNMPDGEVNYSTIASTGIGDAAYEGPFTVPSASLVAGTNVLAVEVHQGAAASSDVVFGVEVLSSLTVDEGRPFGAPPGAYIELHNRGVSAVDLTGWRIEGGIEFVFAPGTLLGAGGFLVVAEDRDYLAALHPGAPIVGNFVGRLSNRMDRIVLEAADGNPADEVTYLDGGRWPEHADGGGPSLELRDPRADNSRAEAWAASIEGGSWRSYSYEQVATANIGPTQWNEFVLGLLDEGEALLDDLSVVESPGTAPVELIQNGSFEAGADRWRLIGNHRHSSVVADPDDPSNHVLHLVATGPTEHMHNHAETTLASGRTVVNGRTYRVSFRAMWLVGSNALHTRLYFNRLPRTTILERPEAGGTPGEENSSREANIGPTFDGFGHSPAVPRASEAVTVSVAAADPNGVAACTLRWSVNEGAWASAAMAEGASGTWTGTIPGQTSGAIVQFYVEARDGAGATATYPAAGPDSRALYKVEASASTALKHVIRIVLTPSDTSFLHLATNVMSNDLHPATVIYDEREVFYDVGVHLKGSERGRNVSQRVGFSIDFQADHLFRGVHRSIAIDRSGGWAVGTLDGQDEILIKHMIQHAGGIPGEYDDVIHVVAPRAAQTGAALLQMARYENLFLDSQWENGSDGTLFDFELIYWPLTTQGGSVEGLKLPEPDSVLGVDIQNHGDDKEVYRWNFLIQNNRDRGDYSGLIRFAKTWSLSGSALQAAAPEVMDVDEWMRTFAIMALCGVGDAYTWGNNHNLKLWVRPQDGKVLAFPWDWDFAFVQSATAALWGNQNLAKIIALPPFQHLYYGHLLDILETTYNTTYMSRWTTHYGTMAGESYSGFLSYIGQRAAHVRSRLPAAVDFRITTNGGADFTVDAPTVDLEGDAWIDVALIVIEGREAVPALSWPTITRWKMTVPLDPGPNALDLVAVHRDGRLLAFDGIVVTSSAVPPDPTVLSIDPVEGVSGTRVTIAGRDFLPTMEVLFDGTPATSVSVLDSTTIQATVPAVAPGTAAVIVRNSSGGSSSPFDFTVLDAPRRFVRGDANLNGVVDVSDAVRILLHLFGSRPAPCEDAADSDDDESVNLTDALVVLRYLFQSGPAPNAPFPSPGEDAAGGQLGCDVGLP